MPPDFTTGIDCLHCGRPLQGERAGGAPLHLLCFPEWDRQAEVEEGMALWPTPVYEVSGSGIRFEVLREEAERPRLQILRRIEDLTGKIFGHLAVLEVAVRLDAGRPRRAWRCRCSCGEEILVTGSRLMRGVSSCAPCGRTRAVATRWTGDPRSARRAADRALAARLGLTLEGLRTRRRKGLPLDVPKVPDGRRNVGPRRRAAGVVPVSHPRLSTELSTSITGGVTGG